MVSAAVAAFFYLRVGVLMYSPLPAPGAVPGDEATVGAQPDAEAPVPVTGGTVGPANVAAPGPDAMAETHPRPVDEALVPDHGAPVPVWAGAEQSVAATTQRNAALLLDADPVTVEEAREEAEEAPGAPDVVPVPALTAVAIALCVAVTVVFGIIPGPLVDLAHQATLLFFPS